MRTVAAIGLMLLALPLVAPTAEAGCSVGSGGLGCATRVEADCRVGGGGLTCLALDLNCRSGGGITCFGLSLLDCRSGGGGIACLADHP